MVHYQTHNTRSGIFHCALWGWFAFFGFTYHAAAQDPFASMAATYVQEALPVLKKFCFSCHNREAKEGEIDLQRFANLGDVRQAPQAWESALAMLQSEQMPPEGSQQLGRAEKQALIGWIEGYLDAESRANAGDPGRVVLRRLNNVEFDNTVADLIGVDLHLSREFPVDGAAGEGFVNTGDALAMSPGLFQKYMDAARQIAAHAVLLPDGMEFGATPHRRDWVQKRFREIAAIYSLYADEDGLLPLKEYLAATLEFRERANSDMDIDEFATQRTLNPIHFRRMWRELNAEDTKIDSLDDAEASMLVMNRVRVAWRNASSAEFRDLLDLIRNLQEQRWRVDPLRVGWYEDWQTERAMLGDAHTLRYKIPTHEEQSTIELHLVATPLDAASRVNVVWQRPRFEAMGKPPIPLANVVSDLGFERNADGEFLNGSAPGVVSFKVSKQAVAGREFVVDVGVAEADLKGLVHVHVEQSRNVWKDRSRMNADPVAVKRGVQRADQAINGRAAVRFGEQGHVLLAKSEKLRPSEFSIIAVAHVDNDQSGIMFSNYDNPINWGKGFSFGLSHDRRVYFFTTGGTEETYGRMWSQQIEPGFRVLSVSYDKEFKRIYADGKLVGEERSKGLDYEGGGGTKASLGSLREFGEHFRGALAELVLLDGAESKRRISVERALGQKYAIGLHDRDAIPAEVAIRNAVPQLWYSAEDFKPLQEFAPDMKQASNPPFLGAPSQLRVKKLLQQMDRFRDTFPLGLCFNQIKPLNPGAITARVYHREDGPLYRLMLTDEERQRLDRAWRELHFIGRDAIREYEGFDSFIGFTTQVSLGETRHFEQFRKPLRERAEAFQRELIQCEPSHLAAIVELANKAWRQPITRLQRRRLHEFYEALRAAGRSHEDGVRLTLTRVFLSPAFLYRKEAAVNFGENQPPANSQLISDHELATRLSYFLWSTLADDALREAADAGKLVDGPDATNETLAQMNRMCTDDRVRQLAVEFICQWMGIRRFDTSDTKNERAYPEFAALRDDLYEEAVRFLVDLIQRDGSVLELIDSEYTFVNAELAKHYHIAAVQGDGWQRLRGVPHRGGMLTMGAVLATQAGATRTSPVLRGNWIVETLLGEHLPDPPATVPELPDISNRDELSVRQLTEQHTSVAACANCHQRIDPFGFALEAFDAIGRRRTKDLAGHAVDTQVKLRDGTQFSGVEGLKSYLLAKRRDDFLRQFCRKLLGYALGRATQLSDRALLDEMMANLQKNDFRFSAAVETVVRSKQFRYRRVEDR